MPSVASIIDVEPVSTKVLVQHSATKDLLSEAIFDDIYETSSDHRRVSDLPPTYVYCGEKEAVAISVHGDHAPASEQVALGIADSIGLSVLLGEDANLVSRVSPPSVSQLTVLSAKHSSNLMSLPTTPGWIPGLHELQSDPKTTVEINKSPAALLAHASLWTAPERAYFSL